MKKLVFVACVSLLLSGIACKKETIRESTTSDWFMTNTTGFLTKVYLDLFPTYNINPQNIIINKDSIVIKKAGLYHFEGTHHFSLFRQNPAFPVYYDLSLEIRPAINYYTVGSGAAEKRDNARDAVGLTFALDVYITENTTIRLINFYENVSIGGSIFGTFGGYRKGE